MNKTLMVSAIAGGVVLVGAVAAYAGHAVSPQVQIQQVRTTITPPLQTVTATATTTATATKPVMVPSPVYVTVSPTPQNMSGVEARAYCENLAMQAWPEPPPNPDPVLDQAGRAYAHMQQERAFQHCMAEQGY